MIRLEVAVAAPLFSTLTYLLPPAGEVVPVPSADKYIGRRALVPLGRRTVTGFIVGISPNDDVDYTLKEVYQVIDGEPLFHLDSIPFFLWIAEYYHFPIGEVISTALPAGLLQATRKIIRLQNDKGNSSPVWPLSSMEPPSWYLDLCESKQLSHSQSKKLLKDRKYKHLLKELEKNGVVYIDSQLSELQTREREEICYFSKFHFPVPDKLNEINRQNLMQFWVDSENKCDVQLKYTEVKALYYFCHLAEKAQQAVPRKELLRLYKSGGKALKQLCEYGVLETKARRVYRNPLGEIPENYPVPTDLSVEQQQAIDKIKSAIISAQFNPFLLFGVTGGGKTEVYLHAAACCLKENRDILVLVPEIALATQLEAHFISRFPGKVALLHSGLSRGERFDQWSIAAKREARIVIGARSAVFAPLPEIGLIIVDEEHDTGFKQDDGLRYNGRDAAVMRARQCGCTIVLGSATPSITSFHNAINNKYSLLRIENRIGASKLPRVEVIDLNDKRGSKKTGIFHQRFLQELEKNLERGEQSLVLLNRRGFSASYLCQDCGTSVQCKHCNISLTYHKLKNELKCHYCGYRLSSKLICDTCHSEKLIPFGVGTERVEETLKEKYPSAVIKRLDSDTAASRNKFLAILKMMRRGEIDILIGTQMIAKGHHFPNVTFVGVVWADGGLNMPDFRAAEKTYQLLSQVTGRAGRGEKSGRVIVQTMRPNHYAIELARQHRYEQFYEKEIDVRKRPQFPPFVRLVQFKITGEIEYDVNRTATNLSSMCRKFSRENDNIIEVLGPAPAPLEKINDRYRWQVLLKGHEAAALHVLAKHVQLNHSDFAAGGTKISIDIDPENMM